MRGSYGIAGMVVAAFAVAPVGAMQEAAPATDADTIVVTGESIFDTKVDYQAWRRWVPVCEARNRRQNPALVAQICDLTKACVARGARGHPAIKTGVDAELYRRFGEPPAR